MPYKDLTEEQKAQLNLIERYQRMMNPDYSSMDEWRDARITVSEALSTPDASILIPRVIVGQLREAAEPNYIASKFFQQVRLTEGRSMVFPAVGAIRAYDIAEGQEYPQDTLDFTKFQSTEIRVGKTGVQISITDEMIEDSQWDVIGLHIRAAGRAMARLKEEKCYREFRMHGHTVFDNSIRADVPEAGTTGLGPDGNYNDTMSVNDFIDMVLALMANEYIATDVLMHPLTWSIFVKNNALGQLDLAALGGEGNGPLQLTPASVQGRLPMSLNVNLTPFMPIDRENRLFDMYVLDRNNVGIMLVKDPLSIERFDEPRRDIQSIKVKERYGIGLLDEGRAVVAAKNISMDLTYPAPTLVRTI